MNFQNAKNKAQEIASEIPFLNSISTQEQYESALQLVEELFEDYEANQLLVDVLSLRISNWEDHSDEFKTFNEDLEKLEAGVPLLTTLMQQYHLKASDLKEEIGGKSLVSQILNGKRSLTREHIKRLSLRFQVSPAAFFG